MQKYYEKLRKLLSHLSNKNYTTLAGTMSFFFILSGLPMLFLISVLFNQFKYQLDLEALSIYIPNEIINIANYMQNSNQMTTYSIFIIITAIYSSSTLFFQLRKSGEMIYIKKKVKSNIFSKIIALIAVIILLGILFLVLVVLSVSDNILINLFGSYTSLIFKYLFIIITPFIILIVLNKVASPLPIKTKDTLPGSLFTLAFWIVASFIFSLYVTFWNNLSAIYGTLAFIIICFLWVYLIMNGLIIGIIINHKYLVKKS